MFKLGDTTATGEDVSHSIKINEKNLKILELYQLKNLKVNDNDATLY